MPFADPASLAVGEVAVYWGAVWHPNRPCRRSLSRLLGLLRLTLPALP